MTKPEKSEYDAYYGKYISLVEDGDLFATLAAQPDELNAALGSLDDAKGLYAYAPDKWTIKEVISHLNDGERMFGYRAFRISRGDTTPIEGFEQDGYIENARPNARSLSHLLDEFRLLRKANMFLLNNLNDEDMKRMGTASGLPISVRALANIMGGHVTHHANILQAKYFA